MPKRTYSRHEISLTEISSKRQRIELESSSPAHEDGSSEGLEPRSSPPSSPTPSSISTTPELTQRCRKPVFSFLRQARGGVKALRPVPSNAVAKKLLLPNETVQKLQKVRKLTQLTLDFGLPATITCTKCGMSYTPSQSDDVALHTKTHARFLAVLDLPLVFRQSTATANRVWGKDHASECIIQVTNRDESHKKRIVERIINHVEQELGGVGIPRESLWGEYKEEEGRDGLAPSATTSFGVTAGRKPKHKVFMYLKGRKCVGLLLAESINEARRVLPSNPSNDGRTITASEERFSAVLGISRIWTSDDDRRAGIATALLDAARDSFIFAVFINKDQIAFSQPTESGARLARRWFGKEDGWLVYSDSDWKPIPSS